MPNTPSKTPKTNLKLSHSKVTKLTKPSKTSPRNPPTKNRSSRRRWHHSFRRSYREDYIRDLEVPGLAHHAATSFRLLFQNWRLFLPLLLLMVLLNIFLVGLMSQDAFNSFNDAIDDAQSNLAIDNIGNFARAGLLLIGTVATGGLNQGLGEAQVIFAVLIFVIIWLVTIYLLRHLLAGHHPKLRDGLYNALTPLLSTLVVFFILLIQLIPVMIVIITYSAAIETDFLTTPFYALVYFIFAALLIILSLYLVSNSFLACVAVSAPGLYPIVAIRTSSELIAGRRIRLIIRFIYLVFVLALCWIAIILPVILIDMWLKNTIDWLADVPIVPFFLLCMTVFSAIYFATYSYLFYRRMLDYDD